MKLNDFYFDKIFVKVHRRIFYWRSSKALFGSLYPTFSSLNHNVLFYRHYGLYCLTAITFTTLDGGDLANKRVKIYFAVFRVRFFQTKFVYLIDFILVTQYERRC
jgi:hypothetical protein